MITSKSICVVHPRSELHDPDFAFEDERLKLDSEPGSTFRFDRVLGPGTPQDIVYREAAKRAVLDALDEHHPSSAAFIATGAVGSGKTYIMTGGAQHFADRGLIPRSIDTLFDVLSVRDNKAEYQVSVTFIEIYQGRVIDLLEDASRHSTEIIPRRQTVSSAQSAFKLLCQGDGRRQFEERPLSPDSSPSHVVFALHVSAFGRETCLAFVDISAGDHRAAAKFAATILETLPPPEKQLHNTVLQEAYLEARASSAYASLSQLLRPWLNPGSSREGWPTPGPSPVKLVFVQALRFAAGSKTEIMSWLRASLLIEACIGTAQQSFGLDIGEQLLSIGVPRLDPPPLHKSQLEFSGPSRLPSSEPVARSAALHSGLDAGMQAKTNSESGHASASNALKDDLEMVADMELSPLNWWARLLHDLREESLDKKPQDGRERRMATWADSFSNGKPEPLKTVPMAKEKPPPLKLSSMPTAGEEDWEMQASKPSSVRQSNDDKASVPSQSRPACGTSVPKVPAVRVFANMPSQSSPACETSVPQVPAVRPVENLLVMRAIGNVIPALTCPSCGNPYVKEALFCFACGQRRASLRPATMQLSAPVGPATQLRVRSISPQPARAPRIVAGPVLPGSQTIFRAVSPQPVRRAPLQASTVVKYPSWAPAPPAQVAKTMPVPAPILLQSQRLPSAPSPALSQRMVIGARTNVGA